ncbi:MAG: hypothetical protein V3T30_02025 [Thermodesulfobacteriota bacterium]
MKRIFKNIIGSAGYGLVAAVLVCFALSSNALALTNYVDPVAGYPGTWPTAAQWSPYTYGGVNLIDDEGATDGSTGGTTPQNYVDVGNYIDPASYFYSDGTNLYFRFLLKKSPLTGLNGQTGSKPYNSASWVVMIDYDNDGFGEFAIFVNGAGASAVDDIEIMWHESPFDGAPSQNYLPADTVWLQDAVFGADDGVDGEAGTMASWDTHASALVFDYGRTRVVDLSAYSAEGATTEQDLTVPLVGGYHYLDIQIPIASLDAAALSGPTLTTDDWFAYGFSTANSNSNPFQKDVVYDGCYTPTVTDPFPFGDILNAGTGAVTQSPVIINDPVAGACGAATVITVEVMDTLLIDAACPSTTGVVVTSVTSVDLYYYYDTNGNGLADDGEQWTLLASATAFGGIGPWQGTIDFTAMDQGNYLVKAIATDGVNTTDSADTDPLSPTYNYGSNGTTAIMVGFSNTCGTANTARISGYVYNDASQDGVKDTGEDGLGVAAYVKLCTAGPTYSTIATADTTTGYYLFTGVSTVGSPALTLYESADNNADCTPSDPTGWVSTTPADNTITIASFTTSLSDQNFGDAFGKDLFGFVFNDADHSATKDPSEGGLGSTVYVKKCSTGDVYQDITSANTGTGAYSFTAVSDGSYKFIESSDNNANCVASDLAGWVSTTSNTLTITMSGEDIYNVNFGDFAGSVISGFVFEDIGDASATAADANNATLEAGEPGIANVQMRACTDVGCGAIVDTTYTDESGAYSLWVDSATVVDTTPVYIIETDAGQYLSTGDGIAAAADSTYTATTANRNMITYTMSAGDTFASYNYGDVMTIVITPDNSYVASAGDSVTIHHTINIETPGDVALMLTTVEAWNYLVYDDTDCDEVADAGAITPAGGYYSLNSGTDFAVGSTCVLLRTVIPPNTADGTVEKLTVIAYEDWRNTAGVNGDTGDSYDDSNSKVDTITVNKNISGTLKLVKWVKNITQAGAYVKSNTADPCDELEYMIEYKNIGSSTLKLIVLADMLPDKTSFVEDKYNGLTKDVEVLLNATTYYGDIGLADGVTLNTDPTISVDLNTLTGVSTLNSGEDGFFLYRVQLECIP